MLEAGCCQVFEREMTGVFLPGPEAFYGEGVRSMIKTAATFEETKKTQNGVKRMIFAMIAILLEIFLIYMLFFRFQRYEHWITAATSILSVIVVLALYSDTRVTPMKMPWIMLILLVPVFGIFLYILIGLSGSTRRMQDRYCEVDLDLFPLLPDGKETLSALEKKDKRLANIAGYLKYRASYPAYQNTEINYYDDAAKGLEAQKRELRLARNFIFMEYHAIEDAESWQEIEEILEERARAGVDVRVFYDDMGSIGFINTDFVKKLEEKGIRCKVFNPFRPVLNMFLNNRDHRKITVIDGLVGFTGGYNIANEYFNITHPYGIWKDTGIRLEGDAVKSLTAIFLEMWNANDATQTDAADYQYFFPETPYQAKEEAFVVPYADSPLDQERVGEEVYMALIEYAKDYIWFMSPYLVLSDDMIHTLCAAAKRGVDVRIITPGIPDKKTVYKLTRSYYHQLIGSGVRIFEYSPGFVHAKMCIVDDTAATCGTINLDYRSLYHHFENGCLFSSCRAVSDVKEDFIRTMKKCREMTERFSVNPNTFQKTLQVCLRLFAPLM